MNGSNVSCAGGSDGSIDLTIAGGTGPYSTTWSHGPTTEDLAGLSAGSYDVDVLDANGCSATASFSLTAPDVLESDMAPSQFPGGSAVSCTGASDGSIDLTVSGGTAPMMISWSGPGGFSANTEDIDDLGAGAYTATVTDANGCVLTSTVTLTGPAPLQAQLLVPSVGGGYDVACAGDSTASVQAVVSGGTPGYQLS
ncbi:MAG: SprB repeat-containing protein, partial [Flavobacteriales bacterium]|nr:SprB repeat-containing protein [Flavobacteriales bacterium]